MLRQYAILLSLSFILLIQSGCESQPNIPQNAKLIFHGPAASMNINTSHLEPGAVYIQDTTTGKQVGAIYISEHGTDKSAMPYGGLEKKHIYTIYYVPDSALYQEKSKR